jgi:hypothetical protein
MEADSGGGGVRLGDGSMAGMTGGAHLSVSAGGGRERGWSAAGVGPAGPRASLGCGAMVGCRGEKYGGAGSAQANRPEEKVGRRRSSSC